MNETHGRPDRPDPGTATPSLVWPPPADDLDACEEFEVERSSGPSFALPPVDLEWPPTKADLDAVAVFAVDAGAIEAPAQQSRPAPPPVHAAPRSYRRPLMTAAGLLATAVVAWSELRVAPSSTSDPQTPQTMNIARAPVATASTPPAHARSTRPLSGSRPDVVDPGKALLPVARAARTVAAAAVTPALPPAPAKPEPPVARLPVAPLPAAVLSGSPGFEPVRLTTPPSVSLPQQASAPPPPQTPAPTPERVMARAEPVGPSESSGLPATRTAAALPPADVPRIHAVLHQYASAYRRLDAAAAREVWPSLDSRALARAFDGLQSQQLVFDDCDVAVSGERAQAACHGSATYVPRVGDRRPRTAARQWSFQLERVQGAQWRILTANMR